MYYTEDNRTLKEKMAEKEDKVLFAIIKHIKTQGESPTVREITKECQFKSTSTTHYYLNRLKEKDFINWKATKHRSIVVLLEIESSAV